MRQAFSLSVLAIAAGVCAAEPKEAAVRALDIKVDAPARGRATEPTAIASAEQLAKAIPDDAAVAAVKKVVDFEKEKVVYFAWSGSGQDKVTFASEKGSKGPEVTFSYTPGKTRDLRPHHLLFAMPKDATYKVVPAAR